MGFPDRRAFSRPQLKVEQLEDRTVPAKLDAGLSEVLGEIATTGTIIGDKVNVVMTSATDSGAALAASPFAASVKSLGFGIYNVTLASGTNQTDALNYFRGLAGVESAAADELVNVQATPNDTSYSSLYGMTKIGAPTAWDTTTGSPGFVVAVIDSGIDTTHQDLYLNTWLNSAEIPTANRDAINAALGRASGTAITFRDLNNLTAAQRTSATITDVNGNGRIDGGDAISSWSNGTDADGNGFTDDLIGWDFANSDNNPFDDNNHGTHVAGTIGAIGNNGTGVVGVNWQVQMMGLKFLAASGSGSLSGAIGALNYAVAQGVKVSNNSWGGGGFNSTLAAAIGRARDAGHIFVAAAGNSAQNIDTSPSYPASYISSYNNVVNVAATDSADRLASFSNFGRNSVTLAAPGVGILSTTPNNTYSSFNGTSMAAPHVAGAIALYWSQNPTLTYTQVISKLTSSVDVVSGLSTTVQTSGRLNVAKMFSGGTVAPAPKVTSAVFNGVAGTNFSSVRVTFDRAIDAGTFTAADVTRFVGPSGASIAVSSVTAVSSTVFDITFATQTAAGAYSLTFGPNITSGGRAMDQNNNGTAGEAADTFTATGTLVLSTTRTYGLSNLNVTIRDNATVASSFTVADNISITDLNVNVTLTHTYVSDLVITLQGPTVNGVAGPTVTLFNRRGGSGDNLTNTRFDDEATTAIANGLAPFNGTFRPDGLLSAFDGRSTAGVWTLRIRDAATTDTGRLTAWSITATGSVGGGTGAGRSLGFRAEDDFDAAATADTSRAVAAATVAPAAPTASASAPSALGFFGLLGLDDAPVAGEGVVADEPAREERVARFAAPTNDLVGDDEDDFDAVLAMLYMPPSDADTSGATADEGALAGV